METEGSEIMPTRAAWGQIPLFHGLSGADIDAVAACLIARSFAAGDVLIRQDVWCGELFILRTGLAQVSLDTAEGGDPSHDGTGHDVLRRLVPGECFGEMSLITGRPPSATIRALMDCTVWALGQEDFLSLALTLPQLARNINTILRRLALPVGVRQAPQEQVIVLVGASPRLAGHLAGAMARCSAQSTLYVDFAMDTAAEPDGEPRATLADLLNGRLRPGAGIPSGDAAVGGESPVTIVRGQERENGAAASIDLPGALRRLAAAYQYLLVAAPLDHPVLTPHLMAYATHVLVAGRAGAVPDLRAALMSLPIRRDMHLQLAVLLTEAPSTLRLTVGTVERWSQRVGAPVRAIVPASRDGTMSAAIAALARALVGQRIGLVLGAGGAKGFAHVGVLRALRRAGVPLDCVAGASIGALVGAGVAMDASPDWLMAALQASVPHIFRPTLPLHSMLSNRAVSAYLRRDEVYGSRLIEDLPIPFAVSAVDLAEGREILMRHGLIWKALLASMAIPGIYPPVRIGRHWLVDGGVVNPVPVSTAQLLGADMVIAVDLSEPLASPREPEMGGPTNRRAPLLPATILRSRDIMMSEIRARTIGEPGILIKPRLSAPAAKPPLPGLALRNFGQGERFVDAGEAAAEDVLPLLRQRMPWLGQ